MLAIHLYVSFEKISIQVFHSFFQGGCLFFDIELYELFLSFGYHIICRYFFPFHCLSSHFSVVSFAVKWPLSLIVIVQSLHSVQFFSDPMDSTLLAPLSIRFPRQQEYWSGVPFPSPGDLPDPGIELASPEWKADFLIFFQADSLPLSYQESPLKLNRCPICLSLLLFLFP